jgi:hypothetical protein
VAACFFFRRKRKEIKSALAMPSNAQRDSHSDDDYIDDPEVLDAGVFHIWDPLQKPVTLQYTTEQLHSAFSLHPLSYDHGASNIRAEMIHEGDIDLDPEYQRGRCYVLV